MTRNENEGRFPAVVSFGLLALAAVAVASLVAAGGATAQSGSGSNFDVAINATNAPVTENDTLEVEVIIENTGSETDNQQIVLETEDGVRRDSTTIALDGGARVTRNLSWDTESGDAGEYTINVSSEDDFATRQVTVNDVAEFDVDIRSTNEPVLEGETLTVNATVENTDSSADTQDVELRLDGRLVDTTTVGLDGDESEKVTLEWETDAGDAGDYEANVSTDTDRASTSVAVSAPPRAAFTRSPATPNVNQAVVFDASGSTDRDGDIVEYTWEVDGENVSGSETLSYTFTEAGDHEVRLYVTDDDGITTTTTRTISVNAPPRASIPSVNATVGEEVTVEANVSDDGTISRYEWYVDGELVTTDRALSYTFDRSGTHQIRLQVTDDDGATTATTKAISVASDATPTATPTPTLHDPTVTDTAEPPEEEQPGFGPAVALVALLAAALVAARRR